MLCVFALTATTVSAKTLDVRLYGAVGDGNTNDQPALQAALDAAVDGDVIYLPPGTYMLGSAGGGYPQYPDGTPILSALVNIKNNIEILGDGAGTTVLTLNAHAKMRALTSSGSNTWFHDFAIDGNKANRDGTRPWPGGDVVDALLYFTDVARAVRVSACEVRNGIEDGIGFWRTAGATVDHCTIHDNGTAEAGAAGISFSGATKGSAGSNTLSQNSTGIGIAFGATDITLSDNVISANLQAGVAAGDLAGTGETPSNLVIRNNLIQQNAREGFAGVYVDSASESKLVANQIINNYGEGIHLSGSITAPSWGWTIVANTSSDTNRQRSRRTQSKGIRLTGYSSAVITDNVCSNNGSSLTDQISVESPGAANTDWSRVNTISYKK